MDIIHSCGGIRIVCAVICGLVLDNIRILLYNKGKDFLDKIYKRNFRRRFNDRCFCK